jgi:hypothetical protein
MVACKGTICYHPVGPSAVTSGDTSLEASEGRSAGKSFYLKATGRAEPTLLSLQGHDACRKIGFPPPATLASQAATASCWLHRRCQGAALDPPANLGSSKVRSTTPQASGAASAAPISALRPTFFKREGLGTEAVPADICGSRQSARPRGQRAQTQHRACGGRQGALCSAQR